MIFWACSAITLSAALLAVAPLVKPSVLGTPVGAVAALLGAAFGWLAIRRQGIYFAMITLALAQMVAFFALEVPFTGGEDGIQAVPRGHLFGLIDLGNTLTMYYFVLAVFVLVEAAVRRRPARAPPTLRSGRRGLRSAFRQRS